MRVERGKAPSGGLAAGFNREFWHDSPSVVWHDEARFAVVDRDWV